MEEAIDTMCGLMEQFEKFEKNFTASSDKTKGYLEGRLEGIKELLRKMCSKEMDIHTLKTEDNEKFDYFKKDWFSAYEGKYYGVIGKINEHLEVFKPTPVVNQDENSNRNQRKNNQQNDQSNVKLPKISLPTFEGSYHTWLSFKNRFTSLIHNSKNLSNVEKLDYLKSCVTGEAEKQIQRYQITDENYAAAWDRLNEKYDNKRILQDTQIETIIDRKEVKIETAKELRELLDVVQESLEALKNLQVDTASWDPILVVLIKRKLPFKTREEWEKQLKPKEVPTYKQLIDFLEQRYRTVESLELVGGVKSDIGNKYQTTYELEKSNQSSNYRANCLVCNSVPHSLMVCETFLNMTVGDRYAFVNANRVCRNCLGIGHIIKYCSSNKRCFKCNGSHHTLLHIEESNQNSSQEPSYASQSKYQSNYSSNYHPNSRDQSRTFVTKNQQNSGAQAENQSFLNTFSPPNQQIQENQSPLNPNAAPYANLNQSRSFLSRSSGKNQPMQRIISSQRSQNHQNHQATNQQSNQSNQIQQRRAYTTASVHQPVKSINQNYNQQSENETLFPTAIVNIKAADGTIKPLRALLDQCSGEVYIKESVAKMLGTKQEEIQPFGVTGLEDVVTSKVEKATNVTMVINKDEKLELKAHIVKSLVGMLPQSIVKWPENLFKNIKLADTNFASPNNVDIMLGMEVYTYILLEGVLKEGGYLAQNTKLGWIISGKGDEFVSQPKQASFCGFTRKRVEINRKLPSRSEQSKKYFAPQRNSGPVYPSNQKTVKISEASQRKEIVNHKNVLPPRLSLIDVNVNRLRKSDQIANIVNNFEQRWKSSSGLSNTSILMSPVRDMSIFAMMERKPNRIPIK